ncbi:MAG: sugar ABC transporter permease [Actinomycetota bacterium]|nr:sugar ABC transporter permease [Actinomycetota bacterium]
MSTAVLPPTPGRESHRQRVRPAVSRRRRVRGDYLFLVPGAVFVVATVVYPLGYNVLQSFQNVGLAQVVNGGAEWVGLDNYRDQFGRSQFWEALRVSMIYTCASVALSFGIGMGLALLFNRSFPGRNTMRSLTLMAWILPTVVSANVWRWLLDGSYGLVNAGLQGLGLIEGDVFWLGKPDTALIAVTFATAWTFAPFAMIMLLAGLQSVPGNLYESARLDGAGAWQQFARITMPLIRPVSLTTLLLLFIYTFKTFDTVFLMTGGGPGGSTTTLPIYAYEQAFEFFKFDTAAVGTTVLLSIPMLLSILYFRSMRHEERA